MRPLNAYFNECWAGRLSEKLKNELRYRAEAVLKRSGFLRRDEKRSETFFISQEMDLNLKLENFLEVHIRDTTPIETCSVVCCVKDTGEAEVIVVVILC